MSKLTYTLQNASRSSFTVGAQGTLAPLSTSAFEVEEDGPDDVAINSLLATYPTMVTLISVENKSQPYSAGLTQDQVSTLSSIATAATVTVSVPSTVDYILEL